MGNNWTTKIGDSFFYGLELNTDNLNDGRYAYYNNPEVQGLNIRKGVRDGCFVRDIEIVPYGFTMLEGIGWKNFFKIC
jgi:hypothetical protein